MLDGKVLDVFPPNISLNLNVEQKHIGGFANMATIRKQIR